MTSARVPEAGGATPHIPVLGPAVVQALAPRKGAVYVDATFGAGGHTRLILETADCRVIAFDRDASALALGGPLIERFATRLTLVQEPFSQIEPALARLGLERVDGVLMDLGVSSMQLDRAERGFSFRLEGPLDMRMSGSGPSAADVVANASTEQLAAIIGTLGEERHARAVARAVVAVRQDAPIRSTRDLAEIVGRVVRSRPGEIHPATRTFQALRLLVNQELGELVQGLQAAERVLAPGGRLAVIAFHSLEDRIVKRFMAERGRPEAVSRHRPLASAEAPSFRLLSGKPIVADAAEIAANPRARSARLRAAERTEAAPSPKRVTGVPGGPELNDIVRGR